MKKGWKIHVTKVFVSHASEDKERFAVGFATKLRTNGIDAWLDKWEIGPGDSLVDKIFEEGIGQADAFIIVLSKASVQKKWVRAELNVGVVNRIQKNTKLIPVVIDHCEIPSSLQNTAYVRVEDHNDYDEVLDRIVMAILGIHDKPPLGKLPTYTQTLVDTVPGLTKVDSIVLKMLGDQAMQKGSTFALNLPDITEDTKTLDLPQAEVADSFEILLSRHYLEAVDHGGGLPYPLHASLTSYGFEQYAKTYISDYAGIVETVARRIVLEGDTDSKTISDNVKQPPMLVEHILKRFKDQRLLSIRQTMGRDNPVRITDVTAELRRRVRRESA
jgi:hypothetical protein